MGKGRGGVLRAGRGLSTPRGSPGGPGGARFDAAPDSRAVAPHQRLEGELGQGGPLQAERPVEEHPPPPPKTIINDPSWHPHSSISDNEGAPLARPRTGGGGNASPVPPAPGAAAPSARPARDCGWRGGRHTKWHQDPVPGRGRAPLTPLPALTALPAGRPGRAGTGSGPPACPPPSSNLPEMVGSRRRDGRESWKGLGWKGPSKTIQSKPLPWARTFPLNQVPPSPLLKMGPSPNLTLKDGTSTTPLGNPFPHPHGKTALPYVHHHHLSIQRSSPLPEKKKAEPPKPAH